MPAPKSGHQQPRHPPIVPGKRFGKLVVVRREKRALYGIRKDGSRYRAGYRWLCRCDCGREAFVCASYLNAGMRKSCYKGMCRATSCGLFTGRNRYNRRSRTYGSYKAMFNRCINPKSASFERYGGRGIKICPQWLGRGGFAQFLADMGKRPSGKTLDRENPFGHYSPENCQWATPKFQANNQCRHLAKNHTPEEIKALEQEAAQVFEGEFAEASGY